MQNKPAACTKPVWEELLPKDKKYSILAKIREESILLHGEDLTACPKRKLCFTKECLGRPLPTKSPTFQPYYEELKKTHNIVNGELFITTCSSCPFKVTCKETCNEMSDYMNKELNPEPSLIYKENLDNYTNNRDLSSVIDSPKIDLSLSWDVLTADKEALVKACLFSNKDFRIVAKQLGFYDEAQVKYEYYSCLNRLSEYSIMRDFIKKASNLTDKQEKVLNSIYFGKKSLTETAKYFNITKQAVSDMLKKVIISNKIKIPVFVRKVKGIPVYQIPEVIK